MPPTLPAQMQYQTGAYTGGTPNAVTNAPSNFNFMANTAASVSYYAYTHPDFYNSYYTTPGTYQNPHSSAMFSDLQRLTALQNN